MDLTPGKSLLHPGSLIAGRYEVVRTLGSGGMGTVLEVVDKALENEPIALKLLYPHLAQDKTSFARFRNEVLIARRLSHPNIVRLYDIGNAGNGYYFISMEFVPGGNLTKQIYETSKDSLSFHDTLRILQEIASGIAHAHHLGVVHRDLKPDNVLMGERGEVKVTDFGLARTLYIDKGFTDTGEAVGTPYYMAPEQLRGDRVDGRCDIYAFGLMAYEIVVGRRPFFEESYLQLAAQHLKQPIPDFASKESGIPKWYEDFVKRCSAKNPDDRFETADEVAEFLAEKRHNISKQRDRGLRRPAVLGARPARDSSSWRSPAKLAAGALVLLVLLGAALYFILAPNRAGVFGRGQNAASEQLFANIRAGNSDAVFTMLASGVELNTMNPEGQTPLLAALESGRTEIAHAMIESGADINLPNGKTKITPLMLAAKDGAASELFQELLKNGAQPDARDAELRTPLQYAAANGNISAVRTLLEHKAFTGVRDRAGQTALIYAVRAGNKDVVELLIREHAEVNAADDSGKTALFYAVEEKTDDITEALLRAGADPGIRDKNGKTALEGANSQNKRLLKARSAH